MTAPPTLPPTLTRYLMLDAHLKAAYYILLVMALSLFAEFYPPPPQVDRLYITKKENVFNQYGVKLGWLWTAALLLPFTLITASLHRQGRGRRIIELMPPLRMIVATAFWYLCTHGFFSRMMRMMEELLATNGLPHGSSIFKRLREIDISGHVFLLVFCNLIITEESRPHLNLPYFPASTTDHREYTSFNEMKMASQWLFGALSSLHIFWDSQLMITALYYHSLADKSVGAIVAAAAYFLTYSLTGRPGIQKDGA